MPAPTQHSRDKKAPSHTKPRNPRRIARPVLAKPAGTSTSATDKPVLAKLFQNGRSQAVRLPKAFRFEGNEVQITRQGSSVVLTPTKDRTHEQYWEEYFRKLDSFQDLGPFPDCEDDSVTEPEEIFPKGW